MAARCWQRSRQEARELPRLRASSVQPVRWCFEMQPNDHANAWEWSQYFYNGTQHERKYQRKSNETLKVKMSLNCSVVTTSLHQTPNNEFPFSPVWPCLPKVKIWAFKHKWQNCQCFLDLCERTCFCWRQQLLKRGTYPIFGQFFSMVTVQQYRKWSKESNFKNMHQHVNYYSVSALNHVSLLKA